MKIVVMSYTQKVHEQILQGLGITQSTEKSKLPSVTTVLGQTQPKEKQESSTDGAQRVGRREAQKNTRDAAIRGTAMHKYSRRFNPR